MLTKEDLTAIGEIVDGKIHGVESKIDDVLEAVNKGFQGMQNQMNGMQSQINDVDGRLKYVESNMVTKDFLERRLEKTDGKINALVNVLEGKRVITEDDKRAIHA